MTRIWVAMLTVLLGAAVLVAAPAPASASDTADTYGFVDPVTGLWFVQERHLLLRPFYFGNPGDYPFMGDWDCDGVDTPGLYRQSDGYVYLRNSNTQGIADISFFFGNPGDVPIAGDFNADGCDTVSIHRPSSQRFYIINQLGTSDGGLGSAEYSFLFGDPSDKPFVGDFNGNGQDTIGLHRESTGLVYFRDTNTTGIADNQFYFGDPGDRFMAGDWTGDGTDTPGLFRPSNRGTYLRHTNTQGNADEQWFVGEEDWLPIAGRLYNCANQTSIPTTECEALVLPNGVALLSAHSNGIDLLSGSSSVPVLTGVDVSLAWPDYLGGVVFQRVADRPEWEFDHDLDRWMPIWTDSAEASGVEWIPQVGGPAEMLVSGDELSTVSPYRADTTLIDGAATLVYNRTIGVEHPCADVDDEDECMWRTAHGFAEHVIALDLETGQERPLGIRDVFETYSDVSIGGSVAAVTGAEPTEVAMVDVADLAPLGTTGHVLETVSSAWMVYTPEHHCEHQPPESYGKPGLDGLVSPDGTRLALVESHPPCSDGEMPSAYIVVIDVGGRGDDPVVELNARLLDPYAWVVDFDGEYILIETGGQSLVVDRQGAVTPLPDCECRYRFWSEPS